MKRQWRAVSAVILTVLLLYGCKGQHSALDSFKPEANSIFIDRDGMIASGMVESFSAENQGNYRQETLQNFVMEEVALFNESLGAARAAQNEEDKEILPVAVRSCELKDTKVMAVYQYKDSASFLEFSRNYFDTSAQLNDFGVLSVLEARKQGWLSENFVEPGKNGEQKTPDAQTLSRLDKGQVVRIDASQPVEIQVEGSVRYMTAGVTAVKKNIVQVSAGVQYLIFW